MYVSYCMLVTDENSYTVNLAFHVTKKQNARKLAVVGYATEHLLLLLGTRYVSVHACNNRCSTATKVTHETLRGVT